MLLLTIETLINNERWSKDELTEVKNYVHAESSFMHIAMKIIKSDYLINSDDFISVIYKPYFNISKCFICLLTQKCMNLMRNRDEK